MKRSIAADGHLAPVESEEGFVNFEGLFRVDFVRAEMQISALQCLAMKIASASALGRVLNRSLCFKHHPNL